MTLHRRIDGALHWQAAFQKANKRGADTFGTLWLQATADAVSAFRETGFSEELEHSYRFRAGVAHALYAVLMAATQHPNNLARVVKHGEITQ